MMFVINEHMVSEVICVNCLRRWTAARPFWTKLSDLECPDCGQQGFAIETGEVNMDGIHFAEQDKDKA